MGPPAVRYCLLRIRLLFIFIYFLNNGLSYVFLIVVPEVKSPRGAEQQQEGPRDEHRHPGLQEAAGGGGFDGHGGVGLRDDHQEGGGAVRSVREGGRGAVGGGPELTGGMK